MVKGIKSAFEEIGIAMSPLDMLKAKVAAAISRHVQAAGMTQAEAAEALGIDQPKASKLLRGRSMKVSTSILQRSKSSVVFGVGILVQNAGYSSTQNLSCHSCC